MLSERRSGPAVLLCDAGINTIEFLNTKETRMILFKISSKALAINIQVMIRWRGILAYASGLTMKLVRSEARRVFGNGTKVKMWHDGSGHILPPPPYRVEENLYSFHNESSLRVHLPGLPTSVIKW